MFFSYLRKFPRACEVRPYSKWGGVPSVGVQQEATGGLKRMSRTDSHEYLSVESSGRVNQQNVLMGKGRRWGGRCVCASVCLHPCVCVYVCTCVYCL